MCNPIFSDEDADLRGNRYHLHKGYARRSLRQTHSRRDGCPRAAKIFAHHEVCMRIFGRKPDLSKREVCDHINRNPLDNRRCNLRIVSYSLNTRNSACSDNARLIYPVGNKWKSQVCVCGRKVYLGLFKTPEDARNASLAYIKTHTPEVSA